MAASFPTTIASLTNPASTDYLNSPAHATQHANANDEIEALEAKVGVDNSAVTTSHDYILSTIKNTKFRAYRATTAQSIPNDAWTTVQLNKEDYDIGEDFDSSSTYTYTVPVNGYYLLCGSCYYGSTTDTAQYHVNIVKGAGSTSLLRSGICASGNKTVVPNVSGVIYLEKDEEVRLRTFQDQGSARNLDAIQAGTFLSAHLLSLE